MSESIIITIGADGGVEVAVKGVKGKSCKDVTREVEKALGKVTSDKTTSEYLEVSNAVVKNRC